jgi:hypothetical protein
MNAMGNTLIVSNHIGPGGEPADRIYGGINDKVRLVNADYTDYKGTIKKKRIYKKSAIDGSNITTHIYITDDGRYFDNGGMPILKPDNIEEIDNDDTSE